MQVDAVTRPGIDELRKIASYAWGFLARHAIAAMVGFLFTTLGVPYIIILVYALSAGLPAFEVFDALGTHMMRFAVFGAIATVVILAMLLLPGFLLILDRWSVSDEEGADKDRSIKRQLVLSRLRWYMAIVPGLVVFSLSLLLADTPHHMYHIPVIIISMSAFLLLLWYLFARYKGIRPQVNDYREVLRSASGLLAPNFISFSYLLVFSRIAERELLLRIDNGLYRTLIALVIGMFFLIFVSILAIQSRCPQCRWPFRNRVVSRLA